MYNDFYSVLSELYNLGEQLFMKVDSFSDVLFYNIYDDITLMNFILPGSFMVYIGVCIVSWVTDTVT